MGKSASKESQTNREKLEETLRDDPMDLIQRNYMVLVEHLDSEQAVDRLFQNFTLTPGEHEELFNVVGAQRTAKMLVTKLRTKSRAQIGQFVEIIKIIQPYLYNIMLSNSLHAVGPHFGWMDNNEQDCEPCQEQATSTQATDWCYQCCEAMCQQCATIHKSMKLLRSHSLKKLSDLQIQAKEGIPRIPSKVRNSNVKNDSWKVNHGYSMPLSVNGDREGSPGATDLVQMTIDGKSVLLVTDWHNECVKSFAEIGTKVKCKRLKMAGCPFRMTKMAGKQIAVTMSMSCLITIINVGMGVLEIAYVITGPNIYDGICFLEPGKFAVSGQSLDIISANGEVLQTIDDGKSGEHLFSNSDYLAKTLNGDIIVSDIRNCRVVCVSQIGQVRWMYQPQSEPRLECPNGVFCDQQGNVYVTDWDRHSVTLLTSDGQYKQTIVSASDRVYHPRAVCTNDQCSRLFVIQDGSSARIYQLSKN